MNFQKLFTTIFLVIFYSEQASTVLLLLECPHHADKCKVLLACSDRDSKQMIHGIYLLEEEIEEINLISEKINKLNRRTVRGLFYGGSTLIEDTLTAIGGGFVNDILSDFQPSQQIYLRKDVSLLDEKRFHLLQAEQELLFDKLITNLSEPIRHDLFKENPAWRIHDLDSEGKTKELTGYRKTNRGSATSSQKAYNSGSGAKISLAGFYSGAGSSSGGIGLGPGGSPPTKKPTLPTKPTPESLINLDSDGESGSQKSFDADKINIQFPDFSVSDVCYADFKTRRLETGPNGITLIRGLRWATAGKVTGIKNSCNMDSFLTHFILRAGQCQDFADRYLRLTGATPGAAAEQALVEALGVWDQSLTLNASHPQSSDRKLKKTFIEGTGLRILYNTAQNRLINVAGDEFQNIFEQLRPSWSMAHQHRCSCDENQYEYLSPLDLFSPEMLDQLNSPQARPTKLSKRRCTHCQNRFEYQSTLVGPATWFIPFGILNENEPPTSWPTVLQFENSEPRLQSDHVTFDLGYISYSTLDTSSNAGQILHHTSLQYFGGQWYYYDDQLYDGRLRLIQSPDVFIRRMRPALRATSVIYFRREAPNMGGWCNKKNKKE